MDTEVLLHIKGECPWNVTRCMVSVDESETLRTKSEKYNLEIEVFGYDISEPEWIEHFYYKNGEIIKEFNLLSYFYVTEYEDGDVNADLSKYILHDDVGVYELKPEYREPFKRDKKQKRMKYESDMDKLYGIQTSEEVTKANKSKKTTAKKTEKRETKAEREARQLRELRLESLKMMGVPIDENGMAIKETDGTVFLYDYFGNENKLVIPEGVTSIFYKGLCRLKSVEEIVFPASVKTIGDSCFTSCENLRAVHFTDKTTDIGEYVFYNCPNLTIYAPEESYAEAFAKANDISYVAVGLAEEAYKVNEDVYEEESTIEERISKDNMYEYKIVDDGVCITRYLNPSEIDGKSVYKFEKSPFGGKRKIRINPDLIIPSNIDGKPVVELDQGVFQFLTVGFDTIIISEGIKRINKSALYGDIGIISLHLPSSIEYIDPLVFSSQNGDLKDIYLSKLKTVFVKKGSYAQSFITQYKFEEDFVPEIPEIVVVE